MLLTIGAVIVVLGVLIFVHELGHFIAAKAVGVQVLRFSLGFGKPLVSVRRGETEYWISMLPLGGYVKMAGMEEQEGIAGDLEGGRPTETVDPARAFDRKPVWARLVVLLAGVTMNVLLALGVFTGIATIVGSRHVAVTTVDSLDVLPVGVEMTGTLRHGDHIIQVGHDTVRTWDDLTSGILKAGSTVEIGVEGRSSPVVLRLRESTPASHVALAEALVPLVPARLGIVRPGFAGYRGGLRAGDRILRANGDSVRSWFDFLRAVRSNPTKSIEVAVMRGDQRLELHVTPDSQAVKDSTGHVVVVGLIGAYYDPPTLYVRVPLRDGLANGLRETRDQIFALVGGLASWVSGHFALQDLGGPILIGQLSGQAARLGLLDWFLPFLATFSINLAVLNLLPIPLLDGGQVVFVLAEAVRRRPLPLTVRLRLQQIGFVLLVCLMIFAIGNDVVRSFFH